MIEAQKILGKGLFPKEMIPPFNSEKLDMKFDKIERKIQGYGKDGAGKCISFNIPRLKSTRRKIGIPNPLAYYHLCKEVELNWNEIQRVIGKSKISLSKPKVIDDDKEYIITEKKYGDIVLNKIIYSMSAKYIVYADISRFHGTIYTHSIPWAFHGKNTAKLDTSSALFGNKIDTYFRNLQDKQTLGIPTGPICSYVIAEAIASEIDFNVMKAIESAIKSPVKIFRFIDDYYFFCDSLSDTEIVITELTKALNEYELELNPDKTKIFTVPVEFEPIWLSELRLYTFSSFERKQEKDLVSYFSKVINYSNQYDSDFVMKYGISRIKNLKIHKKNWIMYQSLLFQCMVAEPSVMKVVLEILLKHENEGYIIRRNDLKNTLYLVLDHHCLHGNIYEILWSLWIAKSTKINISQKYGNKLVKVDNPLVAIMVNHLQEEKLLSRNLNKAAWVEHESMKDLYSEHWIYTYEALRRNWIKAENKFQINCNFYKALDTFNVSFFNPDKQIELESFVEFEDGNLQKLNESVKLLKELVTGKGVKEDNLKKIEEVIENSIKPVIADREY